MSAFFHFTNRNFLVSALLLALTAPLTAADRATEDLFQAIRAGNAAAFQAALGKGAEIDGKDEYKNTPLMIAILYDREQMVRRLVERGAAVNATGGAGQSPLILAAQEGQTETVRFLLGKGARMGWKDSSGENAFTRAVLNNQLNVMRLLLDRGANPNERNWLGFTPLMIAAEQSPEALNFLIDRGAQLRVTGRGGLTPLMLAGMRGNADTVKILLSKGARPNDTDSSGRTALIHSVRHPAVVRLLLGHRARTDLRDRDGRTALDHARRRKASETVGLLRRASPAGGGATDGSRLHGAP